MSEVESVARVLEVALPAELPERRWFGDKGRAVRAVTVADAAEVVAGEDRYWLAVVDVAFAAGEDARYFVPVAAVSTPPHGAAPIGTLDGIDGGAVLVDAFSAPGFLSWMAVAMARAASVATGGGRFDWQTLNGAGERLRAAAAIPGRLGTAEQSNTSIRYGDAAFLKVFRRLRTGVNPDEEIGWFLATATAFDRFPRPLGSARYADAGGDAFPLALAQEYVPSVGDGWGLALERLAAGETGAGFAPAARRLGARTGQLHAALASGAPDPAFAPEQLTAADAAAWEQRALLALNETERALAARSAAAVAGGAPAFARAKPALERRAAGFRAAVGGWKTRVHGDYHLGQTLRTPDEDWVILDFEGEPARPIEERRAKTSPLKDVAGMLRSFAYARGAAWRALDERDRIEATATRLAEWEAEARSAFLDGYRGAVGQGPIVPVPTDPAAFAAVLSAWELDKALYEIAYELDNRPDWLELPLGALLGGVEGGVRPS